MISRSKSCKKIRVEVHLVGLGALFSNQISGYAHGYIMVRIQRITIVTLIKVIAGLSDLWSSLS
jgi:hypothetical protein